MWLVGSMTQHLKQMSMQMRMAQRMKNPYMQKGDEIRSDSFVITQTSEMQKTQMESAALSRVVYKLRTGQPLNGSDLELLRQKAPELYQRAMQIKKEREAFRKELDSSRTKQQAHKVHEKKLQQFINEAGSIKSSGMSAGDQAQAMDQLSWRMAAIDDEYASYRRSARYQSLPEGKKDSEKTHGKQDSYQPIQRHMVDDQRSVNVQVQPQRPARVERQENEGEDEERERETRRTARGHWRA